MNWGKQARRAWDSARGGFDPADAPPVPRGRRHDKGHRAFLISAVVTLSALMFAVLAIPGAALLGRFVGIVNLRLGGAPGGKIKLPPIAQRSVIVDANGAIIATLAGEQNRRIVSLAQVSPAARAAVIAIEDSRFYEHRGIDPAGLLRAVFANAAAGGVREGGSTITQQLVKNLLVGTSRTLDRKIKEAQYAVALERTMTKNQILELYLNEAYFGEGAYGIEAAAELYFGTTAALLDATQGATLAGAIRAPETYDPLRHPSAALRRRNVVLERMVQTGSATRGWADQLEKRPLGVSRHALHKPTDPYVVDFIKQQILSDPRFGPTPRERAKALFQAGLRIETTIDSKLQDAAKKAVDTVLDEKNDPAAAVVSIDPRSGALKAMVGGKDFSQQQFNFATGHNRQPGSTFKMFVLAAALDSGISPGLTLDTPSPLHTTDDLGRPWNPTNYSGHGEGIMSMRKATELSINSFFVQLIQRVGPQKVVDMAHRLGITTELKPFKSLALGAQGVSPFEMASSYGTLADNGVHCRPYVISRVVDATGRVLARNDPSCERALDASVSAQATDLLHGVILRGTGKTNGDIGRPAAGKTGTTDNYTDAWFMGFTPQFSTAVWLGYPQGTNHPLYGIHGLPKVFGGSLPAMIWNRFMRAAHANMPILDFPSPPAARSAQVPNVVGMVREDAIKLLTAGGFTVRTLPIPGASVNIVQAQDPPAGTTVEAGAMVTIEVSDGSGAVGPGPGATPSP